MKFCPRCGRILLMQGNFLVCDNCGYKEKVEIKKENKFFEKKNNRSRVVIFEKEESQENLPIDPEIVCPKCENHGAYFWTLQTRASDEAETKFFKCVKCGYVWRSYD
ncbi:MAG: transcription factor S [Nanopusillaceae archaeon]